MTEPLTVAVQMDPIETVNIDGDSTFALMLEAQKRGHTLWHYDVKDMSLHEGESPDGRRTGRLLATARPVTVQREAGDHYSFGARRLLDLGSMDTVLMRQDPPFDMAYITATHMLEHIHPQTLVVNDPKHVRDAPEKLLVTHFPDLMPPTLITWDPDAIRAFRAESRDIIVKPLFGNGGAGVFRIKRGRREPGEPAGDALRAVARAADDPALRGGGAAGRQARAPGRRRAAGRHQPGAGRGRGTVQHARGRASGAVALTTGSARSAPHRAAPA